MTNNDNDHRATMLAMAGLSGQNMLPPAWGAPQRPDYKEIAKNQQRAKAKKAKRNKTKSARKQRVKNRKK